MLCACANSLAKALSALAPVGLNANLAGGLAAGLNANAQLAASANAALAASAQASANLALALQFSANFSAMAQVSALANFCGMMHLGFGINMGSSAAPAELSDLMKSLVANGWNTMMSKLPLDALPKLQGLGDVAAAMPAARANLGINLLAPNAQAQLQAAANAAAAANANAAASLGISASAAAAATAQMSAALAASAALQSAFGLGGTGGLGTPLAHVAQNMAALPNFAPAFSEALVQKAIDLLNALGAIHRGLGVDLSAPGAGKNLDQAISEAGSIAANRGMNKSFDKSFGTAPLDFTHQKSVQEAVAFSKSKEFNKAFGQGVPGVPTLANLLAILASKLMSDVGTPVTARSPCGPQCLFMPFLPPACLCPKVKIEAPKLPELKPSLTATASLANSGSASSGVAASASATSTASAATSSAATASQTAPPGKNGGAAKTPPS